MLYAYAYAYAYAFAFAFAFAYAFFAYAVFPHTCAYACAYTCTSTREGHRRDEIDFGEHAIRFQNEPRRQGGLVGSYCRYS